MTIEDYSCQINPRIITSKKIDDDLFGKLCKAKDLSCNLHDSIVIWNINIIHYCPLVFVKNILFNVKNNFIYSEHDNLLFTVIDQINHCGEKFYSTEEGILLFHVSLITNRNRYNNKKPDNTYIAKKFQRLNQTDSSLMRDLILSTIDFSQFTELKNLLNTQTSICANFIMNLNIIKSFNDKFSRIFATNGDVTILYSKNNTIIIPKCKSIKSIIIRENTDNCYRDIPITYKLENKTITGFLNNDNIIIRYSIIVDCSFNKDKLYFLTNGEILTQTGNKISYNHKIKTKSLSDLNLKLSDLHLQHSDLILDGIDSWDNIPLSNQVIENGDNFLILSDTDYSSKNKIFNYKIFIFLSTLLSLVVIPSLAYHCYKNRYKLIARFSNNKIIIILVFYAITVLLLLLMISYKLSIYLV